jgi:predicted GIY-YIG superfamily endonuclease
MNSAMHRAFEREMDHVMARFHRCDERGCRNGLNNRNRVLCIHCRTAKPASIEAATQEIKDLRTEVRRLQALLVEADAALRRREIRREGQERLLALQKLYVPAATLEPSIPGRRPGPPEHCYLVRCETTGNVKIGKAGDLTRRLAGLQRGSGSRLTLVASITGPNGLIIEAEMHKRFAAHRIHGEWFSPAPEIFAAFGVESK